MEKHTSLTQRVFELNRQQHRASDFEEKLLKDYLISGELEVYDVSMNGYGTVQVLARTSGHDDNYPFVLGGRVKDIFNDCWSELESEFNFTKEAFTSLKWNPNDVAGRILKVKLQPKLIGRTGDDLYPHKNKPWDMNLETLEKVERGRGKASIVHRAKFVTFGSHEKSGDFSEYKVRLYLSPEDYKILRNSPEEHRYKLRLELGKKLERPEPLND